MYILTNSRLLENRGFNFFFVVDNALILFVINLIAEVLDHLLMHEIHTVSASGHHLVGIGLGTAKGHHTCHMLLRSENCLVKH